MESDVNILNPTRELKIGTETITVRELRWAEALQFFKKLSVHAGKLFSIAGAGKISTELTIEKLTEVITSSEDLVNYLVEKSTSRDAAWFGERSASEALTVLDAALELNLSEQILKKAGALGQRLRAVLPGAKVAASVAPTRT